jgi:ankyrin repeat protein
VQGKLEADAQSTALCTAHGLRYDPARHAGCVVCRREAMPVARPQASFWRPATTRLLLALAGVLALALFRDVAADAQALIELARELTGEVPPPPTQAASHAQIVTSAARSDDEPKAVVAAAHADKSPAGQLSACSRSALGLDAVSDAPAPAASAMQRAAARGEAVKVAQEIELGARVDGPDAGGRTPLAWTAASGHADVARVLLDAHANPNLAAHDEVTPLMLAAQNGSPPLLAVLLEHGAHPNAVDQHARSALMYAARSNRAEAISVLLKHEATLEARCERGMTALHHAAEGCECIDAVQRLLVARADVDAIDMDGASALMLAAQAGHLDVASSLIDAGARLDLRDHRGFGVVDYVVRPRDSASGELQKKLFAVLQLLIDHDPEPHLGQDASQTPILFRQQLDEWLRARSLPPLPAYAPREARAQPAAPSDDSHGFVRLLTGLSPINSRLLPAWLYQECSLNFRGFLARVPNIVQQVRISGLGLRSGQQLTLSADAAGNVEWEVDDAILIERFQGSVRADSAFVGRADAVWIEQQPVRRLGMQAYRYSRGAIDFSPWLSTGSGADRLLVSVLDYGGSAALTDVYLHVIGPHAASTLRDVKIETFQPPR